MLESALDKIKKQTDERAPEFCIVTVTEKNKKKTGP